MPTFQQANLIAVLLGKYDASSYLKMVGAPRDVDVQDTTTFGKTSKVYDSALKDASFSFDGFVDAAGALDAFMDDLFGDADTPFSIGWAGTTFGTDALIGKGINKHYEQTGEVGGYMGVAGEFQASGGAAGGKWLHALAAESSSGNGTSLDNSASTSTGWEANAHATVVGGAAPQLTLKIQHSPDNSSWADLATFTLLTAAGSEHLSSALATTTVNRYVRAVWTLAGTITDVTFAVVLGRKRQV